MEFNISTFVLEIFNFLVLIWILQHFLYKPVLKVINKRRAAVDKTLSDANRMRVDAEALESNYENRLTHWEQEKKSALETLNRELESERIVMMEKLKTSLDEERKKAKVIEERRQQEMQQRCNELALKNGASFASKLLMQTAGPELESRLFDLLLSGFNEIPAECIQSIRALNGETPVSIQVVSVYALAEKKRKEFEKKLSSLIQSSTSCHYRLDPALICGYRVTIGPWVLRANLQDELIGFAEIATEPL